MKQSVKWKNTTMCYTEIPLWIYAVHSKLFPFDSINNKALFVIKT